MPFLCYAVTGLTMHTHDAETLHCLDGGWLSGSAAGHLLGSADAVHAGSCTVAGVSKDIHHPAGLWAMTPDVTSASAPDALTGCKAVPED